MEGKASVAREIRILIDTDKCQTCKRCLASNVCKVKAIMRFDHDEPPFLAIERCYDCRLCIPACPFGAIHMAGQDLTAGNEISW